MVSARSDLVNNSPSSITMKYVRSNQANSTIQVLDVESDGNCSIPPIDPKPNGQDEAQNKFSVRPLCWYQCLIMIDY
jgi:hypothetical protein